MLPRPPTFRRAVCVLAVLLSGCGLLEGLIEDTIHVAIDNRIDGNDSPGDGRTDEDPTPVDPRAISINSVLPNRGLVTGGFTIEIVGLNFVDPSRVWLGNTEITCTTQSPSRLRCEDVPAGTLGFVDVKVEGTGDDDVTRSAVLRAGFQYFEPVRLDDVQPASIPAAGGAALTITGRGFVAGTQVRLGTGPNFTPVVLPQEPGETSQRLRLYTPELPSGRYTVTVSNLNGSATWTDQLHVYDEVHLNAVTPFAGPLAGGTALRALGTGFVDGTELRLGDDIVSATANVAETELDAITLAGAAEGPVDVTVTNANGTATLKNGFVFVDLADTEPRLVNVTPNASVIAGGNTIHITGVGFESGDVTVAFGDEAALCERLSDYMLTCVAPPHDEGTVDVRVTTTEGMDVTLTDGFTYLDLRLDSLTPDLGAIAGGTYVTLVGNAFQSDMRVYFNGRAARDVTVEDGTTAHLWTPRGAVGLAEVRLELLGLTLTFPGAYEYRTPLHPTLTTSGGPIEGSVNATVIGFGGMPVRDAFVMIGGTLGEAYTYGFTNEMGQVTLSGPTVAGPLSVHATHVETGSFSLIDINARDVVLELPSRPRPAPEPLPECPRGQPGADPLVRGNIYRIKDEYNTGNDIVRVTTTHVRMGVPLPDPGPKARLLSQGPYEAFVRTGDLVILALAGEEGPGGSFVTKAMGFRPFVNTEPSSGIPCADVDVCELEEQCVKNAGATVGTCLRVYEGMDIIIDTPVDHDMRIEFDNPPVVQTTYTGWASPRTVTASTHYDFGSMGVYSMGNKVALPDADGVYVATVKMPRAMSPVAAAVAKFHVEGTVQASSPEGHVTWANTGAYNLTNTRQTVVLSPFLQVTRELQPTFLSTVSNAPMVFELERLPAGSPAPDAHGMVHYTYHGETVLQCMDPIFGPMGATLAVIDWLAITPGTTNYFELPTFSGPIAEARLRNGTFYWQALSLYSPGVNFDELSLDLLFAAESEAGRATGYWVINTQQ